MLITQKVGHISTINQANKKIDLLQLEWHETTKRILHKRTLGGAELRLKFLKESQNLQQGDVLFMDEEKIIMVDILSCEAIVLKPSSMYEMAFLCYEIGNKHLPLFYEEGELAIPFEHPIFRMLEASGFNPVKEERKLLNQLRTTVASHGHTSSGESLFSRIMKLTSSNE